MRNDMYLITCAARTGSSLLETSLLSHRDIQSHGEVYDPNRIGALRGRYTAMVQDEEQNAKLMAFRDRNQTAFLYKYVFDSQGKAAVGLKLKHEELMLPKFAETREAIRRDTDIKIIHLSRENLFQRFVSWWLVNNVTHTTEIHSDKDRPEIPTVVIPIKECHVDFDRTSARYAFFQKMFSNHEIFNVSYEQLAGDENRETLDNIVEFLGLERQDLSSRLKKVITKDMREIVQNYDELAEQFAGTQYSDFFGE
ncbi:MAG: hypothetical protein GY788_28780 [bacterium]|nr:hypothetical protein [bacterium]